MVAGEISDKETYVEVKNDIQNEIFELKNQLGKIGQSSVDWFEQSSNLIYLAKNAGKLFLEGTKEEKQTLINCVSLNLFLKNKNVEFSLKQPFNILAEGHSSTTVLRDPRVNINNDLSRLIEIFQNVAYMGQMKHRWLEIENLRCPQAKIHVESESFV